MKRTDDRTIIMGAAAGWLGVAAYGVWEIAGEGAGDGWERPYLLFSISLLVAAVFTTATAWGATRSTARLALRRVGVGAGIIAVASSLVAWAVPLWATLLAITCTFFTIAAPRGRRRGLAVVAGAQLVGMAVLLSGSVAEIGRQDSYGDYPVAYGLGMLAIASGSLLGLTILSRLGRPASPPEPTLPVAREWPARA